MVTHHSDGGAVTLPILVLGDAFKTAAQESGIIDAVESPAPGTWVVMTRPDTGGE